MADFKVPDKWVGKTLVEIRNETNGAFRPDVVASQSGVNENTPLQSGQIITYPDDLGSGEYQFLKANFQLYDAGQAAVDAAAEEIKKEVAYLEQYTKENPFVFDEATAKESVEAEYEPYYKKLLEEYTTGVDIQRENIQDEKKLLNKLYELDQGARSRNYQYAIEQAEKGYQGQGLFFSGLKETGIGRLGIENKAKEEEAVARYTQGAGSLENQLENVNLQEQIKQRELGESQTEAIKSGIIQRAEEAQKPYLYSMTSAYKRRFPTGELSVEPYLPAEYLRY